MKKVDLVYPYGIRTNTGVTSLVKEWFCNRHFFTNRGYDVTFFALQDIDNANIKRRNILRKVSEWKDREGYSLSLQIKKGNNWLSLLKSWKHLLVESNYLTSLMAYHRTLRYNLSYIKNYISLKRNPDVVVFQEITSCYHYLKYSKKSDSKVVVFIHGDGSDYDMFFKRRPKLNKQKIRQKLLEENKYVFDNCDRIVWISRLAKEKFCKNHPVYTKKTVAVVNGINDIETRRDNSPQEYKFRMVCTGTVCERKGQYIIVEAMRRMDPEILKYTHLTIIGSGPDHGRLVSLAQEYGLKKHITFTGNLPNIDVPQYLSSENIFVLMSNNEGLPISILEAMRAGLPVISTNVSGIPEEVDERNGLLIDPNIDQLSQILNRLPDYDWIAMGEASRKRYEDEFTFERMMRDYNNMFDELF